MGTSLILRIIVCFLMGSAIGGVLWYASTSTGEPVAARVIPYISPFGVVFVDMLKMLVIPVIFFSLVVGASSLPLGKFGRVGVKTIGWYLGCSVLAALVGVALALLFKPGAGEDLAGWETMANAMGGEAEALAEQAESGGTLTQIVRNLFKNPFQSLASGNFLAIIVFSILFGLAIHVSKESADNERTRARLGMLEDFMKACRDVMFKLVEWILEYSPIGVLALSIMNFGLYGPSIVGPYVRVTLGVVFGILVMIFVVYSLLLKLLTGESPFVIFKRIREAMIMAFITRSSAATLPVSIVTATDELKVRRELASFSLPLGATINMDGVCVHLPMFAILAASMFGIHLTAAKLVVLVLTTVLASIGAGGVPGGSLMLLFIILGTMGLSSDQIAVIVALALGINPILDMFETMNNVTGDLVCTYAVAKSEGLVGESSEE
ncbi:MAG: dicarboxylate/amino acid:cation symporter [bacterium]|nr:dicarboxylate/amino acid:cation symporter [bacterium]